MKVFNYTAVDSEGVPQSGDLKAVSRQQAVDTLRKRNYIVTNLQEKKQNSVDKFFKTLRGVSHRDKIIFTRQLGTMIGAGLPINQALKILSEQTSSTYFSEVITDVARQIDGGSSLYDSLKIYEKEFDRLYLSLVKAGEASGNLELMLMRLAESLESSEEFRSRVKSAMIYPIIIVVVMLLVLLVMMLFVIPQLAELYDDLGADLPFMTQLLINFSTWLTRYSYVAVTLIVGGVWLFRKAMKNESFAHSMSVMQMKAPVFGKLSIEIQLTAFTRTLGMLLGSGIPMLEAIDISKETFSNMIYRAAAEDAGLMVEKGKPLSEGFKKHTEFPSMISEMLAIGELTGKVEDILEKLSSYYRNESTSKTDNLASAIEPIVMVALGVMVGFLIVSLILPIYSLSSSF